MQPRHAVLLSLITATSLVTFAGKPKDEMNKNNAGPRLIETVKQAKNGSLTIPYQQYVLPNGLTLIVHEDHTDPIVHVDVTYHVGSAREVVGRSGFAHFFEHMMFQGSDNVGDDEHFKIVNESGGTLNGSTNRDRTNYFETMPSNQLETALWLEADRMGFFLDAVTEEKFEIQRATVKNERGQNYDNKPYGLVGEKTGEVLYPFGHPYSWLTIGYIEDLDAATLDDLKDFFLRWYGPNNAVLTVAGDVNTAEVVKLVNKYFGPIPAGPAVKDMPKQMVTLAEDKYVSYEDNIRFPLTSITYPSVHIYHEDEPALDILSDILGGGKNSIFYKNFVKTQKALQASVSHPCSELAGQFTFSIVSNPNGDLKEVHDLFRQSLKEFEERGVNADDIEKMKAKVESSFVQELETVSGKASRLASYATFLDDPNFAAKDMARYQNVTPEDVMRVYNTYIKDKPAVFLTAYPKGQAAIIPVADNATRPVVPETFKNDLSEYEGLEYNKAKDNFDRSVQPTPAPAVLNKVPGYWRSVLANQIPVIGSELKEVPAVNVQLRFRGGHVLEPRDKAGIAKLMASMLNESTNKYTTEQMSDALDKLGSDITVSANTEDVSIEVFSLSRNIVPTLALLEEKLLRPAFDPADFERVKKQQLDAIKNQVTQATSIASNVYRALLYGKDNILATPDLGTEETVSGITLEDVKAFYQNQVSANLALLTVVGDVKQNDFLAASTFLTRIPNAGTNLPEAKKPLTPAATTIYFVDKPGAAQSEIRIGAPALPYDATGDYYKCGLVNYSLGGSFSCRINMNLREEKGLTYGTRANFVGSRYYSHYTASGGFKSDGTNVAVTELLREIGSMRDAGITPEELSFTKNAVGQRDALKYESLAQKAGFLSNMLEHGLDKSYVDKQKSILQSLTKEEADALAAKYLAKEMVVIVVGDKKTVLEKLKATGIPVQEVNNNAEPVTQ